MPEKPKPIDVSDISKEASDTTTNLETSNVVEETSSSNEIILDFLPEKPTPILPTSDSNIQIVGELPFDQLGLNSYWPSGRAQWLMEHIHLDLDLPWWSTIMLSKSRSSLGVYISFKNHDLFTREEKFSPSVCF